MLFPGTTPKQTLPGEELISQFLRNSRWAKFFKAGEGVPMNIVAEGLGRPAVWIAGVQKRFGLPVLESYSEGYEAIFAAGHSKFGCTARPASEAV